MTLLMQSFVLRFTTLLLAALCLPAAADTVRDQRARAEATTLLTGELVITPTGTVRSYTLDHADKLSTGVVQSVATMVPKWTFQPVLLNGQPVAARASMALRLVARRLPGPKDEFALSIRSAYFVDDKKNAGFSKRDQRPPRYPEIAIHARVGGTVYLVMELDKYGKVDQLAAEQVNLNVVGRERELKPFRDAFARESLRAAKDWTFAPPSEGPMSRPDQWIVRIPVQFFLLKLGQAKPAYGRWEVSVPGPRELVPWLSKQQLAVGIDAIPDGQIAPARQSLTLQTPLDQG